MDLVKVLNSANPAASRIVGEYAKQEENEYDQIHDHEDKENRLVRESKDWTKKSLKKITESCEKTAQASNGLVEAEENVRKLRELVGANGSRTSE